MSAHNRNPPFQPPSRPRGGRGSFGPDRDFSGGGGRGRGLPYHGPPPRGSSYENGPPPGPRGGYRGGFDSHRGRGEGFGRGGGGFDRSDSFSNGPPPFRHNNSSSTTYPRSQRFDNNNNATTTQSAADKHLSNLPPIVPGGKLLPSTMTPDKERKLKQLEEEAEKLRQAIHEKEKSKRTEVTEWDNRERDSATAGLRSELADRQLDKLMEGEDGGGGVAF